MYMYFGTYKPNSETNIVHKNLSEKKQNEVLKILFVIVSFYQFSQILKNNLVK